MNRWQELKFRFQNTPITKKEHRDLLISIIVTTFIFAFDDGRSTFEITYWLLNFGKIFLMIALAFYVHEFGHRLLALHVGFRPEYRMWVTGLLIGLIFTFLTRGQWYIVLPGGLYLYHMAHRRLGHFRYGLNYFSSGMVAVAGPLFNLLIATFWETLALFGIMPEFFRQMAFINLYYAVFSLLPLPNLDGIHMFFASRPTYVFIFGTLVGYILLYTIKFYSLIFALIFGGICWFLFYWVFEKEAIP